MHGAHYVFHAAALKQVPSCEFFPLQAVETNITGSSNVMLSAIASGVKSVVCLSTDKAVFPINAMGMTKALMEKTAQSLARDRSHAGDTVISCVRYGNVMYSRGSVIPLFVRQIQDGQPAGTVFVGLWLDGEASAQKLQLPGDRPRVRQFAAISALDLLRHRLLARPPAPRSPR